jgi:hypothetical protein
MSTLLLIGTSGSSDPTRAVMPLVTPSADRSDRRSASRRIRQSRARPRATINATMIKSSSRNSSARRRRRRNLRRIMWAER